MEYLVNVEFIVEADSEDEAKMIVIEASRTESDIYGHNYIDAEEV